MLILKDEDVRNALAKHGETVNLRAGSTLLEEGRPSTGIYLILSGSVVTTVSSTVQRTARRGNLVGVPATINGTPYGVSATVTEDAKLVHVSRPRLIDLMRCDSKVSLALLEVLSTEIRDMSTHIKMTRHSKLVN